MKNISRILNIILIFWIQFISNITSTEDEFEELPQQTITNNNNNNNNNNIEKQNTEDVGNYKNLTFIEKLQFQLQRSGDINGKGDFLLEYAILVFIVVWFVYFFTGRGYNSIIAVRWIRYYQKLFSSQFELLSSGHTDEPDNEKLLFKESDYNYTFYASGRRYCKGMSVDISLVRRQDLIMRAVDAVAFPHHDRVTLQFALTDDAPPISLFAITRKGKQNLIRNERKEFKEFSSQLTIPELPPYLVVLGETNDALHLLEKEGLNTINKLGDLIELISLTDLNSLPVQGFERTPTRLLTCVFRFGKKKDAEEMKPLIELALSIIDLQYTSRLNPNTKKHVEKNRKILTDRLEKKLKEAQIEEANRKKQEKIEKEKEKEKEEYEKLSESAKQKKDLKEEKKKKKEENAKLFKLVKK